MTTWPPPSQGQEPPQDPQATPRSGTEGGSDSTTDGAATAEFAERSGYDDPSGREAGRGTWEAPDSKSGDPMTLSDRLAEYRAARQAEREQPWCPSLDDPLEVRIEKAKVSFDSRRLIIERELGHDNAGTEAIPIHQIASVRICKAKPDEPNQRYDRLLFELVNGRSTSVEFGNRSRAQVEHLQDEVSRAVSHLPPTGRRPPTPKPSRVGLAMFIVIVIVLLIAVLD